MLSSQKCEWSKDNGAIIVKYFVTPEKAISIHDVRKMFQEIEGLRNLLKEEVAATCGQNKKYAEEKRQVNNTCTALQ